MNVLHKKLFRYVRANWGQALAIAAVITCGTATYISLASAHRNLELTRDTYYEQYRLADFFIMFEQAPMTAVFKIEGLDSVHDARGRIVKDVSLDVPGEEEPRTGRIVSMPDNPEPVLNDVALLSGRYFDKSAMNEVIVSEGFAKANHLALGDAIRATIEDSKHTLRIVGLGLSPEYVMMIRSAQELVPSPEKFGILWVSQSFAESAFDMNETCNEIVGTVDGSVPVKTVLDRAEEVLEPYGVYAKLERDDQISARFLADEIAGLAVSAKITPAIFLGIAALILLVLLNRMVRNERTEIGLLKAYGYSNLEVSGYYIQFSLFLAVLGCLGGFVAGELLASAMVKIYVRFYMFPLLRARVYPDILARSMGISVAFALVGALTAARHAARIQPAEAMRIEPPKSGARTLIERSHAVWRRLSFTWKMIVRNVSRYRVRAGISVFGVMVSAGIMVVGFFTMDAMEFMIQYQFTETQREDVRVALQKEMDEHALRDLLRYEAVRAGEPMLQYPFRIKTAWREKEVGVIGIPEDAQLHRLMDQEGRAVSVGASGIVLSDRLARELQVGPGATLVLEPLRGLSENEKVVTVRQVVSQYLGSSAYMNIHALSRLLDESFALNTALLQTHTGEARALSKALKDIRGIAAVELKEDMLANITRELQDSMAISNTFLLVFSGVIAFAIIYNATIVSLEERKRELASLRVLGFSKGEVGAIIYRENFLLAAVGGILGLPFGLALCKLLVYAYDTELYRLPFHIEVSTLVWTAVMTAVFVSLANLAARRRIHQLDMVEVLKSRE